MTGKYLTISLGCPIDISPDKDDESLANCNNFDYKPIDNQTKCPFTAHTRKTRPRGDKKEDESPILRRGIPYGVEVDDSERLMQQTKQNRGLLFVCYQGSITNSFLKIQKSTFLQIFLELTGLIAT